MTAIVVTIANDTGTKTKEIGRVPILSITPFQWLDIDMGDGTCIQITMTHRVLP
jgi:hypothetical protein